MYRWSDNQKQWGPFILSDESNQNKDTGFFLDINNPWNDSSHTMLRASIFGITGILLLRYTPNTQKTSRRYGFMIHTAHDALYVNYGKYLPFAFSDEHNQECTWYFPWTEMEHVRHTYMSTSGSPIFDDRYSHTLGSGITDFQEYYNSKEQLPSKTFTFADFDGQVLTAKVRLEEREWRRGRGFWKFLRLLTSPKIERYIDIEFSGETGSRKGSWKGGTIGCSSPIEQHETIESAFRKYCMSNNMTFIKEQETP